MNGKIKETLKNSDKRVIGDIEELTKYGLFPRNTHAIILSGKNGSEHLNVRFQNSKKMFNYGLKNGIMSLGKALYIKRAVSKGKFSTLADILTDTKIEIHHKNGNVFDNTSLNLIPCVNHKRLEFLLQKGKTCYSSECDEQQQKAESIIKIEFSKRQVW